MDPTLDGLWSTAPRPSKRARVEEDADPEQPAERLEGGADADGGGGGGAVAEPRTGGEAARPFQYRFVFSNGELLTRWAQALVEQTSVVLAVPVEDGLRCESHQSEAAEGAVVILSTLRARVERGTRADGAPFAADDLGGEALLMRTAELHWAVSVMKDRECVVWATRYHDAAEALTLEAATSSWDARLTTAVSLMDPCAGDKMGQLLAFTLAFPVKFVVEVGKLHALFSRAFKAPTQKADMVTVALDAAEDGAVRYTRLTWQWNCKPVIQEELISRTTSALVGEGSAAAAIGGGPPARLRELAVESVGRAAEAMGRLAWRNLSRSDYDAVRVERFLKTCGAREASIMLDDGVPSQPLVIEVNIGDTTGHTFICANRVSL